MSKVGSRLRTRHSRNPSCAGAQVGLVTCADTAVLTQVWFAGGGDEAVLAVGGGGARMEEADGVFDASEPVSPTQQPASCRTACLTRLQHHRHSTAPPAASSAPAVTANSTRPSRTQGLLVFEFDNSFSKLRGKAVLVQVGTAAAARQEGSPEPEAQ